MKIVFVGEPAVGKTSLIMKFLSRDEKVKMTIGVKIFKLMKNIVVFDLSGQKRFEFITKSDLVFKNARLVVFVFDLSRPSTLYNGLKRFYSKIKDKRKILVGNKSDLVNLSNLISLIDKVANEYHFEKYFITSAKTGEGVKELFSYIANVIE